MPADGVVVEGRSYVDESMVTGESKPIGKRPGEAVISGTINGSAPLIVKVSPVHAPPNESSAHSWITEPSSACHMHGCIMPIAVGKTKAMHVPVLFLFVEHEAWSLNM